MTVFGSERSFYHNKENKIVIEDFPKIDKVYCGGNHIFITQGLNKKIKIKKK